MTIITPKLWQGKPLVRHDFGGKPVIAPPEGEGDDRCCGFCHLCMGCTDQEFFRITFTGVAAGNPPDPEEVCDDCTAWNTAWLVQWLGGGDLGGDCIVEEPTLYGCAWWLCNEDPYPCSGDAESCWSDDLPCGVHDIFGTALEQSLSMDIYRMGESLNVRVYVKHFRGHSQFMKSIVWTDPIDCSNIGAVPPVQQSGQVTCDFSGATCNVEPAMPL